jgi:hypothetical protein
MLRPLAILLLLPLPCSGAALAQAPAQATVPGSPSISLPQVTVRPIAVVSTSGRFSSLNPPDKILCRNGSVSGHVVSPHLIQIDRIGCEQPSGGYAPGEMENVLMNVALATPADRAKMITGATVTLKGLFVMALETHGTYNVSFLLGGNAVILDSTPPDPSAAPGPMTSYIVCQAPEMDALAQKLGSELCVQSSLLLNLSADGAALQAAAAAPDTAAADDANAISCRHDPERSDLHLPAIACARHSYWDWWSIKHRLNALYIRPAPP